ncbi:hypothetical protein NDU88_004844 [Pleurodeles waltl]|uniref:Uncharacterized protein n=1 Tax=Pleurodeles waltl TaxID=8319 RepID=A0AAV7VI61_PLEWA|nr:hypothetical protein NDU88_004844 [Pleurodeles waltl]
MLRMSVNSCRGLGACRRGSLSVDLEVQVFSNAEGVFSVGRDPEGVLADDGEASSWFVGVVSPGDLVAVRDGYGEVRQ